MGNSRNANGGSTDVLWMYHLNLPKFKICKELSMETVYTALRETLDKVNTEQITTLIISPTDLVSLGYPASKAVMLCVQVI